MKEPIHEVNADEDELSALLEVVEREPGFEVVKCNRCGAEALTPEGFKHENDRWECLLGNTPECMP